MGGKGLLIRKGTAGVQAAVSMIAVSLLVVACGGGGTNTGGTNTGGTNTGGTNTGGNTGGTTTGGTTTGGTTTGGASSLSGVAAAGAAVANGIGYALDAATGAQIPFTTNATTGAYSVDLTGKSGPFLLHVRGTTSGGAPVDLYSLASSASFGTTVNVTPLSDIVVGYAAGKTTASLEAACTANQAACPGLLNGIIANLALSNSSIVGAMPASVLNAFGVSPATFNAITTSFAATHSGVDGLLDAIQVVPPTATGTSYAINLNGATTTPLVTVPVAGTGTAPTANATAPTTAAVTQAANLATALAEVQAAVASFNQVIAAAAPGFPTVAQISPFFDANFLLNGWNASTAATNMAAGRAFPAGTVLIAGSQAPYSGAAWGAGATAPAPSVTYDANNCVTSLSVYFGSNGLVAGIWQYNKTITNPVGCAGSWKAAGDQAQYYAELVPIFTKFTGGTGATYTSGFHLNTGADDTVRAVGAYANVTISGPGLTTKANYLAKGTGVAVTVPVTLVPPAGFTAAKVGQGIQNRINDPYYFSSILDDCALLKATATSATPCYDSTAAVAGSDYVVRFNSAAAVVLETQQHRLTTSLAVSSVPASWYPTITGVTPAQASAIPVNTATTVKTTWTLPAGASPDWSGIFLFDGTGATIWQFEQPATTATSNTINIPATNAVTVAPVSGMTGVIAPIGGLKVGSQMQF